MMVEARERAVVRSQDRMDRIKAALISSQAPNEKQLRVLWPEFFTPPDVEIEDQEEALNVLDSDDEKVLMMPDMDPAEIRRMLAELESSPVHLGVDDLDGGWQ